MMFLLVDQFVRETERSMRTLKWFSPNLEVATSNECDSSAAKSGYIIHDPIE